MESSPPGQKWLLLQPGAEFRLAAAPVPAWSQHHTAGGPGRIAGLAGGKGGTGEPEPGLSGADCQTLLQ